MRRIFLVILALAGLASVSLPACAQYVGQGNAQITCQYYPQAGGGNATPCPKQTPYNKPFPDSTSAVATNAHNLMQTRNEEIAVSDPNTNPVIFISYSTGTTLNPYILTYNMYTGVAGTPTAINISGGGAGHTVTCGTNNHDQPGGGDIGYGYVAFTFCANDSSSNHCGTTSGMGTGSSYACNVIAIGNTVGGGTCNKDITAGCSIHVVPGMHLSEVSCSSWGPVGTISELPTPGWASVIVCSGQNFGPNTNFAMSGGYGTWTFYATFDGSENLTHLYMDTSCDGSTVTLYDVLSDSVQTTTGGTSGCNGLAEPTVGMRTNLQLTTEFSSDTSGTGTITATLPNWSGSCGGTTYTWGGPVTGNAGTDASSFVSGFNGSGLHTSGCYTAVLCANSNCPNTTQVSPNDCESGTCVIMLCGVGCIPADNTGTNSLSFSAGTGALTLGNTIANTKTAAGQSGMFQYGLGSQNWWGWSYHLIGSSNAYTYQSTAYQGNTYVANFAVIACPPNDPTTGNAQPTNGSWYCYDWTRNADGFHLTYSPATMTTSGTANRYLPMGAEPACSPTDCSSPPPYYASMGGAVKSCYICLPNMKASEQPTGWVPFNFDGNLANYNTTSTFYPTTVTDQGEYIAPNGDVWLAWACGDTTYQPFLSVCWEEWPVGGVTGANITGGATTGSIGGFVDRNFASSTANAYWNNINLTVDESTNTMKIIVAANEGSHISRCTGVTSGTCIGVYTSTNINATSAGKSAATFSFTRRTTNFTSAGDTSAIACQNSQDQFAIHTLMLCMPGSSTDGSASMWFVDVNP